MKTRPRWRRIVGATLLTGAGALVVATWPAASASADAPVRTAWWNTVSGNGQSAPSSTPAGGLHVAVAPGQVLAFGAVLYSLPTDGTATLEFKFTSQGTASVAACPTKDDNWTAGDDQPSSAQPAYDCTHAFNGNVSSDGATVTFFVDGAGQSIPGQLSLAIVPVMTDAAPGVGTQLPADTTQPFSMDIDKPDVSSMTITSGAPVSAPPPPAGAVNPPPNPATAGATGSTGSTAGSSAQVPPTLTAPGAGTAAVTPSDTAPQLAPPANGTSALQNAAAGTPKLNNKAHNAALALLVLVAMAVLGTSTSTMQRAPRLLGGAGKHAVRAGATAAAVAAEVPMTLLGVRGLGRFAKARTTPARPLM